MGTCYRDALLLLTTVLIHNHIISALSLLKGEVLAKIPRAGGGDHSMVFQQLALPAPCLATY